MTVRNMYVEQLYAGGAGISLCRWCGVYSADNMIRQCAGCRWKAMMYAMAGVVLPPMRPAAQTSSVDSGESGAT